MFACWRLLCGIMEQQQQQRTLSGSSQSPRSPSSSSQPFLSVSVTDPVKLGNGVQAYISYRVITKVLQSFTCLHFFSFTLCYLLICFWFGSFSFNLSRVLNFACWRRSLEFRFNSTSTAAVNFEECGRRDRGFVWLIFAEEWVRFSLGDFSMINASIFVLWLDFRE